MVLVCDTSSCHDDHLCLLIFQNSTTHDKAIGRTRTGFIEVYAKSLRADCDLDFYLTDMVLVCDTSPNHDDHLCQIIFNSYHAKKLWVGHEQVSLKSMHKV